MYSFFETLTKINDTVNTFVWNNIGLWLLIGAGILLTIITKFFQIFHFGHCIKETIGSMFKKHVIAHSKDKSSISPFYALCTALAATIGTGNTMLSSLVVKITKNYVDRKIKGRDIKPMISAYPDIQEESESLISSVSWEV